MNSKHASGVSSRFRWNCLTLMSYFFMSSLVPRSPSQEVPLVSQVKDKSPLGQRKVLCCRCCQGSTPSSSETSEPGPSFLKTSAAGSYGKRQEIQPLKAYHSQPLSTFCLCLATLLDRGSIVAYYVTDYLYVSNDGLRIARTMVTHLRLFVNWVPHPQKRSFLKL